MPVCAVDNFWGELNIAAPMSSWPRPTTIFKKSNFNHGVCLKISQWNLACLLHKYSETSKPNFRGNIKFLLVHWPLEMYSNSMCRQPAPVCPAMGEIRYNTAGNPWQNEKWLDMHQNQANLFENMHFHHHWSSQLRTVNDVSVWIKVIYHHWKSLLFLYDVELHGGHTKFYQSFQPM